MEQPTSERLTEMPFLLNIGLMMTFKCQVACPHCIVQADPHPPEVFSLRSQATAHTAAWGIGKGVLAIYYTLVRRSKTTPVHGGPSLARRSNDATVRIV